LLFACAKVGGKIYVASGHDKLKNGLKMVEASDAVASSLLRIRGEQVRAAHATSPPKHTRSPLYLALMAILLFFQIPVSEMQNFPSPPLHGYWMTS
jgi:hypothetical protein